MSIQIKIKQLKILSSKLQGTPGGKPPLEEIKNLFSRLKDYKSR